MPAPWHDDLGYAVPLPAPPRRVVSLVPSITEAIAVSATGVLVGATDWCVHPVDLDVRRVRGTKNPDLEAIEALHPDLVVANEEENRRVDVERLRARGLAVWVTDIRSVTGALASLARLLAALEAPDLGWLARAQAAWGGRGAGPAYPAPRRRALVAVWRRPWIWLGPDTYAADVLRHLGIVTAVSPEVAGAQRYPRIELTDLPPHDLVVLPDEPYRFTATDGPEAFPDVPVALVDGQALTWYGPRMVAAREVLAATLDGR